MMSKFVTLIVLMLALGIFFSPSLRNQLDFFSDGATSEEKCTTTAGEVYYGSRPKGVTCNKLESIDTSITVIKSQSTNIGKTSSNSGNMKCDGRKYCSQMKSCKEATFFIRNCPSTLMDGNNDGVPCQKQWC